MSYEKKYEFNGPWLMNKDKIPALQKEVEENFNNLEEKVERKVDETDFSRDIKILTNRIEEIKSGIGFLTAKEIRQELSALRDYLDSATAVIEVGGDQFNRKRERTFSDKLLRIDFDKAKKDLDYFVKRNTDRIECTIIPNQHRHEKEIGELKDKFKELNEILIHNAEQDKENQDYYENKVKELESFCADNKESWSDIYGELTNLRNVISNLSNDNTKDIVNLEQKVKFIEKQLGEYKNKASTDNQVNNWYTQRLNSLRNDLNTTITRVNEIVNTLQKNAGYRGYTMECVPDVGWENKEVKKDKFEEMNKTTNQYIKLLNEKRDIENKLEIEIKNKWKLQEEVNKTAIEYAKLLHEKNQEIDRLNKDLKQANKEMIEYYNKYIEAQQKLNAIKDNLK